MAYLNLDLDFSDHPKFEKIESILGNGASILVIRLWAYSGKYSAEHGTLYTISAEKIENKIGWWGDRGDCIAAMLSIGFIEQDDQGFKIHDWQVHQGHIWKIKERNQKTALTRWANIGQKTYTTGTTSRNATRTTPRNATRNATRNAPNKAKAEATATALDRDSINTIPVSQRRAGAVC